MSKIKAALVGAAAFLTLACVSMGTRFDPSKAADIEACATTEQELVGARSWTRASVENRRRP